MYPSNVFELDLSRPIAGIPEGATVVIRAACNEILQVIVNGVPHALLRDDEGLFVGATVAEVSAKFWGREAA